MIQPYLLIQLLPLSGPHSENGSANVGSSLALCFFCKKLKKSLTVGEFYEEVPAYDGKDQPLLNSPLSDCSWPPLEQEIDVFDERLQQQVQMPSWYLKNQRQTQTEQPLLELILITTILSFSDDHWFVHKLIIHNFIIDLYHCFNKNTKLYFCV